MLHSSKDPVETGQNMSLYTVEKTNVPIIVSFVVFQYRNYVKKVLVCVLCVWFLFTTYNTVFYISEGERRKRFFQVIKVVKIRVLVEINSTFNYRVTKVTRFICGKGNS